MYPTLALHIKNAESVVFLTGAGVSTASGIPDFRSSEGLWTEDQSREYYMSADYFFQNPEDFWKKYKAIFRLKLLKDYQPNPVHQFIKDLESEERDVTVVTQNVDGLHSLANSSQVIEYHGTLNHSTCPECGQSYPLDYVMQSQVPHCQECSAVLKPDVLLFGDLITAHEEAEQAVKNAELLIVMGTSLFVTPFNLLPYAAIESGIPSAIINNEPTEKDALFDYVIHDDLSQAVQQLDRYL